MKNIAPGQYAWNETKVLGLFGRHAPPDWINGNWSAAHPFTWIRVGERPAKEDSQRSNNLCKHPGQPHEHLGLTVLSLAALSWPMGEKALRCRRPSTRGATMAGTPEKAYAAAG